jgi:hypothetical protein
MMDARKNDREREKERGAGGLEKLYCILEMAE